MNMAATITANRSSQALVSRRLVMSPADSRPAPKQMPNYRRLPGVTRSTIVGSGKRARSAWPTSKIGSSTVDTASLRSLRRPGPPAIRACRQHAQYSADDLRWQATVSILISALCSQHFRGLNAIAAAREARGTTICSVTELSRLPHRSLSKSTKSQPAALVRTNSPDVEI